MAATPVVLVLVVTLVAGPVDPRYQALGGPFDLRGLDGVLLVANRVALAVTVVGLVAAAGSLVVRFRRARGVERQQLRWVALAAVLVGLGAVGVLVSLAVGGSAAGTLFTLAVGCCLVVPPVAIGAAVLRYRLYDLDRIISRTLAYGLLTLLLGGGYAVVVLGLGQLLGRDSRLVVAAATLAVAAVFQPARRRIQAAVDRRFNRRRHDTAEDHRGVRRPPARAGRPGHPDRRAAGGGRPDHAADPGVAVAATATSPRPAAVRHRQVAPSAVGGPDYPAPMDVIDWLLEGDPAIRWQVLRDLTDASPDEVAAERARVEREGWGARLLALRGRRRAVGRRGLLPGGLHGR